MGAILTPIDKNGRFHAICYALKQLFKHKKNYSPFLLEMGVVVWAMEYYQEHLRAGYSFYTLTTNHGNLGHPTHKNNEQATFSHDGFQIQNSIQKRIRNAPRFLIQKF
jgi:hypothetical protein